MWLVRPFGLPVNQLYADPIRLKDNSCFYIDRHVSIRVLLLCHTLGVCLYISSNILTQCDPIFS